MHKKTWLMLATSLFFGTAIAQMVPAVPGEDLVRETPRKGWHFYIDPAHKKDEPKQEVPAPEAKKPVVVAPQPVVVIQGQGPKKEVDCTKPGEWIATCGFVEPGDDFDFQAKQRDILLQQMSMRPDSPEAVEAVQRYMKWVIGKASAAANMWYYNMVQNPELDPTVKNPISEVGIALASKIEKASQIEYFRLIREEGGTLIYFTKNDCSYCHDQSGYTRRVAQSMGLQVINVPLDGVCLPGFTGDDCGNTIKPEQIAPLKVAVVPSIYLYVPSNTWIRLASGVTPDSIVMANTVNFFSAYRSAILNGVENGNGVRPTVTFDTNLNVKPTGVASADAEKSKSLVDRGRVLELMGYPGAPKAPAAGKPPARSK